MKSEFDKSIHLPLIKVEVVLLHPGEGGRKSPLDLRGEAYYRPHLIIGSLFQVGEKIKEGDVIGKDYLGVQFKPCNIIVPFGEPTVLELELLYYPNVNYQQLIPDLNFAICEGSRIVGYGKVLENEIAEKT